MATVFKPRYTRALPANATVTTERGRAVAKWTGRGGKAMTGVVSADGKRVTVAAAVWHIRYKDHNGVLRTVPGSKDRASAKAVAADLERDAQRVRAGLEPVKRKQGGTDTLAALADAYRDELTRKKRDPYHVKHTRRRIGVVLDLLDAGRLTPAADLSDAGKALDRERIRLRWSDRNFNLHATSCRSFGKWMLRHGHVRSNPFEHLPLLNEAAGRTFERRALTVEELRTLFAVVGDGPSRYGMTGPDRLILYTVAAFTGCRIGELSSLTPESFHEEGGRLVSVTVKAKRSKRRTNDPIPIPESISPPLANWLKDRPAGRPVFVGWKYWPTYGAKMLKADLEAAGIEYETEDGRFDFHALRVQFVTMLARAGVEMFEAQKLARHSTPALTSNVYAKLRPELRRAADKLQL